MKRRAGLPLALAALLLAFGCTRDEEPARETRKPIERRDLPTPRSGVTLAEARGTPSAVSAHTPAPVTTAAGTTPAATAVAPVAEVVPPTALPSPAAAEPTAPAAVAEASPVPAAPAVRLAVVGRGVDLRTGPSAAAGIRGTFEGRTEVEALETQDGFTRVRAPVIGGGFVEGWVSASSVRSPEEEAAAVAAKPAAPSGKSVARAPTAPKAPASAPGKPAAPSAPKAAAKKAGDKGPDDIRLVPIVGTAKKRPATPFTHKSHYDDYSIACETCHHPVKAKGGEVGSYSCSASGCHTANECNGQTVGKKNKACPNFEDAYHIQCIDCHKKDGGPTKCAECHTG